MFLSGRTGVSSRDILEAIRSMIPSSRLPKDMRGRDTCKFLLGVTRIYFTEFMKHSAKFRAEHVRRELERILRFITSFHADEYDSDLNGMSFQELKLRFGVVIDREMIRRKSAVGVSARARREDYRIVRIQDFETASKYSRYTSWCVTKQKEAFELYADEGDGVFYFCLKNGFENVAAVPSEGCPMDEYGRSMIAISVSADGMLNTATCRWNHDNGGTDRVFETEQEVSDFFGVNFFDTFKP